MKNISISDKLSFEAFKQGNIEEQGIGFRGIKQRKLLIRKKVRRSTVFVKSHPNLPSFYATKDSQKSWNESPVPLLSVHKGHAHFAVTRTKIIR